MRSARRSAIVPACVTDRAVVRTGEHHGHPRRPVGVDDEAGEVHATELELVAHEAAERVVAHDAAEPDDEAEPGRAAREDRPRTADGEASPLDEPLGLPERRLDIADKHEVGVRVTEDEEVEGLGRVGHGRTIPRRPYRGSGRSRFQCWVTEHSHVESPTGASANRPIAR